MTTILWTFRVPLVAGRHVFHAYAVRTKGAANLMNIATTVFFGVLLVVGTAVPSKAQYTEKYMFGGIGGTTTAGSTTHAYALGAGLSHRLENGFGFSGELQAILPGSNLTSNTLGILSTDLTYHFGNGKLQPEFAGGYSLAFRDFTGNMGNFGGGIHYWFQDNRALLLEFRDHYGKVQFPQHVHHWFFRIGFLFK
jgi:hypothetical protein